MVSSPVRPPGTVPVSQQSNDTEAVFDQTAQGLGSLQLPSGQLFGTDGIRGKAGSFNHALNCGEQF
ncbi:MAG: hypothetical protein ACOYM4_22995 [Nodosilinea sp.]